MLSGVRVLDLTRLLPGAYATLMLADMGADVIKIEQPRGGDHMRAMPPIVDGTGVYFTLFNRNKRSVTLDLRKPEAAEILDRLVPRCDVVIDSFRPKTAKRLGLDPASLHRRGNVICASLTGFGEHGPYADHAAHDINYEALAGLLMASAGEPRVPGLLVADIAAAYEIAFQIAAALFARERGGSSIELGASIYQAALRWLQVPAGRRLVTGGDHDLRQLPLRGEAARYNVYETSDGKWLALGALEEKFWRAFCERLGRPDLIGADEVPGEAQAKTVREVRAMLRTRTRDEWIAHFAGVDACLTPVHSVDEALADLQAGGAVTQHEGVTYVGSHWRIRPAPALGAHTDEVLDAIGIAAPRRRELRDAGVI
jgi:alpha-methylacyl-CoA racemase